LFRLTAKLIPTNLPVQIPQSFLVSQLALKREFSFPLNYSPDKFHLMNIIQSQDLCKDYFHITAISCNFLSKDKLIRISISTTLQKNAGRSLTAPHLHIVTDLEDLP
jgi:hypothetical protein